MKSPFKIETHTTVEAVVLFTVYKISRGFVTMEDESGHKHILKENDTLKFKIPIQ